MTCQICRSPATPYLELTILNKYSVQYLRCSGCGLIYTEPPYWLDEAYGNAITSLDIGLPRRNLHWMPVVEAVIRKWFNPSASFLDYGGGYGLFVRLMRDQGFDFYRQDTYCENLFAKQFDVTQHSNRQPYELITAFEVFEHLPDPVGTVKDMLSYGESILFSTELQPNDHVTPENWWYFIPETGQHVSLYTEASLRRLAEQFGLRLYSNGHNLHLMTKKPVSMAWFQQLSRPKVAKLVNAVMPNRPKSLLDKDYTLLTKKNARD
ncbi:class I SAM-dependent methyltransferase [Fibrella sp. WM1]|uniref:class I SAM-dependent methyltransferase n=1 Tax=Fibrella musci TaxID=3242485 RepID=UPI003521D775